MIKSYLINIVFILSFILSLVGCVSLNSHQTGRTVGKKNSSVFGNFNYGKIDSEQYFDIDNSGKFYIAEIGGFYGLKENIDIGIKINSSTHITGISKFQFIGNKESLFASSLGLDLGVGTISILLGATSYSSSLSIYNSIHPTDFIAISFSPRYTYLGFTNFTEEFGFTDKNNIYGYSTGITLGRQHQFSFEFSQYVNNEKFSFDKTPIVSLGYIWNFK